GAAEGMAEGDGTAVDVEPLLVDAELTGAGEDLGGEGLVELDQVDLVDAEAGRGEGPGDRLDWADAHVGGVDAGDSEGDDPGHGLGAEAVRAVRGGARQAGGAVVGGGGVAGGAGASLAEGRPQLRELLQRGVRTRS